MKKNWYTKTVLSYVPTLYLTIAIIVFIAIYVVSEVSMKEAERTNKYSTEYIVDTLESSLMTVERRILEELRIGDTLYEYFEFNGSSNDRLLNYEANKKLRQFILEFPIIHSMYLYRIQDQMVLSMNEYDSLTEFNDQLFVVSELQRTERNRRWSLPRSYTDGVGMEPQYTNVISFSQRTQLPMGDQGIIVVNVSVDALLSNIDKIIDPDNTLLQITAGEDTVVYSSSEGIESRDIMTSISSSYLQWQFTSGIQTGLSFTSLQTLSRIWIAVGVVVIIGSFIYTLLITKRNYRPIQNIVQQIQSFQLKKSSVKGVTTDEFSFIQKAIERLNDENMQYEAQVQEANQHKRMQAFVQFLERSDDPSKAKWKDVVERLGYPGQFQHALVAVVEIDHYKAFEEKYKKTYDQGLIKFAMSNVLQEYVQGKGHTWAEWTRLNRMPMIHMFDNEQQAQEWQSKLETFRVWVAVNLGVTVTIGIGQKVESWEELYRSYDEAVETLRYKISYGCNRTLHYTQISSSKSGQIHIYYQECNALIHDFRLGQSGWDERVTSFFTSLECEVLTNDENMHLLQYFKSLFEQMMEKLPQELRDRCQEVLLPEWNLLMHKESMKEITPRLVELLLQSYNEYFEYVKSKDSKQTVHGIRAYIEENYTNPELSLNLISEKFKLNSKYVSQIFKEQLGINFADFLIELRIARAKQLLLVTSSSINEISAQVGYEIPLSFGRAFKKHVGVSPSDYRKNMCGEESLGAAHE